MSSLSHPETAFVGEIIAADSPEPQMFGDDVGVAAADAAAAAADAID